MCSGGTARKHHHTYRGGRNPPIHGPRGHALFPIVLGPARHSAYSTHFTSAFRGVPVGGGAVQEAVSTGGGSGEGDGGVG